VCGEEQGSSCVWGVGPRVGAVSGSGGSPAGGRGMLQGQDAGGKGQWQRQLGPCRISAGGGS
jgi:hypothetical protein